MSVIIETSIGDITVDLYTDERSRCCMNFLKLCKVKYYNFSLFHTVQQNLVAQTGDPTATGRGGESIYAKLYGEQARFFEMEMTPRIKHTKKGLVSMVNNGSGMHGSQFFFTLADNLDYLDGKHTVFGEVAEGFDILEKLNNAFCGEDNRPHQDIRIYHTIILDDPYDDPPGLEIPATSPGPTEEMLNSDHIPCDADIDEDKTKTEEELTEMMAEKEAKANAQLLEMIGDLPEADVAPPETVLFVCKLNPVTTSEDLEIIFSRFGPIVSCEVIKDAKTGESLQYGFIEFEKPEHCESAYFKMDNVLIDDRRIHVDFSQSVSKLKWKGKGKGVEIQATGDAPIYVLKNQQRQNDNYDLVYEHDEEQSGKDRSGGKQRKGIRNSESGNKRRSRERQQRKRARSRSRSPARRNERNTDRNRDSRDMVKPYERSRGDRSRREDESRQSRDQEEDSRQRQSERSRDRQREERTRRGREDSFEDERRGRKEETRRNERSGSSEDRKRGGQKGSSRNKRRADSSESEERGRKYMAKKRGRSESSEDDTRERKTGSRRKERSSSYEESKRGKKGSSRNDSRDKEKVQRKKAEENDSGSDISRDSYRTKKKKKKHKESGRHRDSTDDERTGSTKKHRRKSADSDSNKAAQKSKKKHKSRARAESSDSDDRRR